MYINTQINILAVTNVKCSSWRQGQTAMVAKDYIVN